MKEFTNVDAYLADEPSWLEESIALRAILLDCKLDESIKWGKPCYAHEENNIAIMQAMKAFLALMFFKGALLDDPEGLLQTQGENSRAARRLCFTSVAQIRKSKTAIRRLVASAIEVERSGARLPESTALTLVDELARRLQGDRRLKKAFEALTAGRQRAYNLYVSGAKQSKTRETRIDKHVERILAGKGLRDP